VRVTFAAVGAGNVTRIEAARACDVCGGGRWQRHAHRSCPCVWRSRRWARARSRIEAARAC